MHQSQGKNLIANYFLVGFVGPSLPSSTHNYSTSTTKSTNLSKLSFARLHATSTAKSNFNFSCPASPALCRTPACIPHFGAGRVILIFPGTSSALNLISYYFTFFQNFIGII